MGSGQQESQGTKFDPAPRILVAALPVGSGHWEAQGMELRADLEPRILDKEQPAGSAQKGSVVRGLHMELHSPGHQTKRKGRVAQSRKAVVAAGNRSRATHNRNIWALRKSRR